MSAHKIVVSVVAIAAAAAAGARSSTDTNISTFSKNSRTCCDVPEDRLALRLPVACGSRLDQEEIVIALGV
jgi:hypothetical protein